MISLKSKPEAIFFDLGGTLLYPDYPFVKFEFLKHGKNLDEETFLRAISIAGKRLDSFMKTTITTDSSRAPIYAKYILEECGWTEKPEDFVENIIVPRHKEVNFWNYLLPGTNELLEVLKTRCRIAIISNSDGRAEKKAIQYGLINNLEFVIDSFIEGVEKPDPEIFLIATNRMGLKPEKCMYVGDIFSIDAVGAKNTGMIPVWIDRTKEQEIEGVITIYSIFELKELMQI